MVMPASKLTSKMACVLGCVELNLYSANDMPAELFAFTDV